MPPTTRNMFRGHQGINMSTSGAAALWSATISPAQAWSPHTSAVQRPQGHTALQLYQDAWRLVGLGSSQ